jgi:excisionase family DNA binding protein
VGKKQRLRIPQAAERLNRSEYTLGKMVRERRIPHYRIGHIIEFDPDELDAWVEAQHVPAKESAAS